ncbi:putative ATP binding protein [Quillaja saponaria]|uniref:ATP binding protein n=1 Tax=Quillaja saponaria TaxID=32244 RepID=A0AAD7VG15_QUISA|nr:putative ATP binding protein [Quillaja saponaria]
MEDPSETQIEDTNVDPAVYSDHGLHAEIKTPRQSYQSLQFNSKEMEENLTILQRERDEHVNLNSDLTKLIAQVASERDFLRNEIRRLEADFKRKEDEFLKKLEEELTVKEELQNEVEVYGEKIQNLESEKEEKNGFLLKYLNSLYSGKDCLFRIIEGLDQKKDVTCVKETEGMSLEFGLGEELREVSVVITMFSTLASKVESRVNKYKELRKKEKNELENTLIAERGLLRAGFGFMIGGGTTEQPTESSDDECEEVPSLASTVERIMKNLRLEITQLRRSLEESRSDTKRLQHLTDKQAQIIAENTLYIKGLEDRERVLAQNVEELLLEMKDTEEEIGRWRKAGELEVEAGKNEIEECDKVVAVLKQELQKTKAAFDISNGKLKLKEELASTAMAAHAAAERSLQLADRRAVELREGIEELTKQIEEVEKREHNRHKVRHICWPWRSLRMNSVSVANTRVQNVKRMLPEMQALLH